MSVDCKHGQLKRSCNICELESENAALKAELAKCMEGLKIASNCHELFESAHAKLDAETEAEISKLKNQVDGLTMGLESWKSRAAKYREAATICVETLRELDALNWGPEGRPFNWDEVMGKTEELLEKEAES